MPVVTEPKADPRYVVNFILLGLLALTLIGLVLVIWYYARRELAGSPRRRRRRPASTRRPQIAADTALDSKAAGG